MELVNNIKYSYILQEFHVISDSKVNKYITIIYVLLSLSPCIY